MSHALVFKNLGLPSSGLGAKSSHHTNKKLNHSQVHHRRYDHKSQRRLHIIKISKTVKLIALSGKCEEIESGKKLASYVTTTGNFELEWCLSVTMTIITV